MSYQNQSDKDHLDIIIGPPGPEKLIDSIHNYASTHDITMDKAWSACIKNTADNLMKPTGGGFNSFTNIFSDVLEEEVHVNDYFLSHYYRCFSTNGQFLRKLNKEDRHEYTAPALNFQSKNIVDSDGNPIDIRKFDTLKRKIIQNLIIYLLQVNWVYMTISYGYQKIERHKLNSIKE